MYVACPISMPSRYMYARLGRFETLRSSALYCLTAHDVGCSVGATTKSAIDAPTPPSSRNAPEMRKDHLAPRVLTEHRQPANTSITAHAETGVVRPHTHALRAHACTCLPRVRRTSHWCASCCHLAGHRLYSAACTLRMFHMLKPCEGVEISPCQSRSSAATEY